MCGACTALVNGVPQSTCNIVLADIGSASITTIEGLSADSSNPLQLAWIAQQVSESVVAVRS